MEKLKNHYIQAAHTGMKDATVEYPTTFRAEALACLGILMMLTVVLAPVAILMYICWYRKMTKLYTARISVLTTAAIAYGLQQTNNDTKLDSGFSTMKIKDDSFEAKIYDNQECFWFWAPVMCEMDRNKFKSLFTTEIGLEAENYVDIFVLEARKLPDDMTSKQWLDIKKALSVLAPRETSEVCPSGSKTGLTDKQKVNLAMNGVNLSDDLTLNLV
uniref:Transmembrane protein n=1 Tax=Pithovirus LCPAC201 TaxID=2506591 RepID=A0A481Z632_9VIRU|nr:MAG: hypothetical protein LCPAC201_03060 [Pithovirus LCPAC201]